MNGGVDGRYGSGGPLERAQLVCLVRSRGLRRGMLRERIRGLRPSAEKPGTPRLRGGSCLGVFHDGARSSCSGAGKRAALGLPRPAVSRRRVRVCRGHGPEGRQANPPKKCHGAAFLSFFKENQSLENKRRRRQLGQQWLRLVSRTLSCPAPWGGMRSGGPSFGNPPPPLAESRTRRPPGPAPQTSP